MKIAIHIPFFYSFERIQYLEKVIIELLNVDAKIKIFIYTNKLFLKRAKFLRGNKNIRCYYYCYKENSRYKFDFHHWINKIGLKFWVHPFFLTWEHRKKIEKMVDQFDAQMYLEDDILFTNKNFIYWKMHKDAVLEKGYNLGFLRFEKNKENECYLSDIPELSQKQIVEIGGNKYLLINVFTYHGFWIYEKAILKEFIKSKEWRLNFPQHGIREKAAFGWHDKDMNRFNGSLIALECLGDKFYTPDYCGVHHLPNNYINHESFCKIKFPIEC